MILRVTNETGDTVVDTEVNYDLAVELFQKAIERQMWGKGIKDNKSYFIPAGTSFDELDYDEVIMLPQQVGG